MTLIDDSQKAKRLTGMSQRLNFEGTRGKVRGTVRRGRAGLYTSYAADQGILNTPAKRWWTGFLMVTVIAAPFLIAADLTMLLTLAVIYAIGGIGLNILTGYAG